MVGAVATVTVRGSQVRGSQVQQWSGVVDDVALVHVWPHHLLYAVTVAPRIPSALCRSRHSRVWTDASAPDVVRELLKLCGFESEDFEFRLCGDYPRHAHICQYRESDWQFLSRLLEREGIYFFWEHSGSDRLVMVDATSAHGRHDGSIRYDGDQTVTVGLSHITVSHTRTAASVAVDGYDPDNPALSVSAEAPISGTDLVKVHLHGGEHVPAEAARIAQLRAELLAWPAVVMSAFGGGAWPLRAGTVWQLSEHPKEGGWQAIEVARYLLAHDAAAVARAAVGLSGEDAGLGTHVRAIPAATQYRPPLDTPTPIASGVVRAVIDGPGDGPHAQLDDAGRYLVRFGFDERATEAGKASSRVRRLQPHGGQDEGMHFPLRKGTEVGISFTAGDPDRPVIVGVVANAHRPSMVQAGDPGVNRLQTVSGNRLDMRDDEQAVGVTLSTPNADSFLHMGGDGDAQLITHTDGNALHQADGWQRTEVKGDVEQTYGASHNADVSDGRVLTVGGYYDMDVGGGGWHTHVAGDVTHTHAADHTLTVGGGYTLSVADRWETSAGSVHHQVSGAVKTEVGGNVKTTIGGSFTQTVGQRSVWTIGDTKSGTLGSKMKLVVGGDTRLRLGRDASITIGVKMAINAAMACTVTAGVVGNFTGGAVLSINAGVRLSNNGGPKLERSSISVSSAILTIIG